MKTNRINKLQQAMRDAELDTVALMPGPNMVYFTGVHAHISERPVLLFIPADDEPAIIIPTLEAMKAEAAGIPATRIFAWEDVGGPGGAFRAAAEALKLATATLGVEALGMRVLELELVQQHAPGVRIAHAEPTIMQLRSRKDAEEIAAMAKAIGITEQALNNLLPRIQPGMTEKQVAALLTQELYTLGADAIAFGPIVSTGPNGASPHAVPSSRPLANGDLLVIDWGIFVDDYPSDITRTFAVGEVEPEFQRIHEIVQQANAAGKAAARPGVTGEEVDRAARDVIEAAGYGDYFIHRTGHGLGLEIHEPPNMVAGNREPLQPGNVFTVEPGIYLPGRGGVRIEDNVVITAEGHHVLTTFPRHLMTVG